MRRQNVWLKVLFISNVVSLILLAIISLHYNVPQKILNKLGFVEAEPSITRYTYLDYRQMAIRSFVNGNDGFEIVMLGDSITEWANWNELLNRVDVANYGIGGDTTTYLLHRLFDIYLAKPKKCFLMIGINDFRSNDTVENVFKNYKTVIEEIKEQNIEVLIQSTLFISEKAIKFNLINDNLEIINNKVKDLNELLKEYCLENKITYLDINAIMSKNEKLDEHNTSDGIHLNKNGYEKWKKIIMEYI